MLSLSHYPFAGDHNSNGHKLSCTNNDISNINLVIAGQACPEFNEGNVPPIVDLIYADRRDFLIPR